MANNVSVAGIRQSIKYIEDEFAAPLVRVGEELIDSYERLNTVLHKDTISEAIEKQKVALDDFRNELAKICNKAASDMDDSAAAVSSEEDVMDDALSRV